MEKKKSTYLAIITGTPIGFLGGLIGLGGAEFRLPVLVGTFKYSVHKAVALNLAVSAVTVISSIFFRLPNTNINSMLPLWSLILTFIIGSMTGAYLGGHFSNKITEKALKRAMLIILVFIGILLIVEGIHPLASTEIKYQFSLISSILCIFLGTIIGLVSSLLGVAGGELTIPALMLIFGIDIKIAGTVSLLINVPAIIVGISKHASNGAYSSKQDITNLVFPMGIGSIIGSFFGTYLINYVSGGIMKFLLGFILIISAIKLFLKRK